MKIAMIFPGYGSQYVGMGKELYDEYRIIQEYFEQASSCLDTNFVKLCFASSDAELSEMRNAYTSIFLLSASIVAVLKERGITPDVVAGFNQGEYAALFAADGVSLPDGLYVLHKLASFYEELLKNDSDTILILVQGVDAKTLQDFCMKATKGDEHAYIALYETAHQHIVAGHSEALERVRDMVSALSAHQKVNIEYADMALGLHSDAMRPVAEQCKLYFNKVDFHDLSAPLIESRNGHEIKKAASVHDYMLERMLVPIVWPQVMNKLAEYDVIIQVGPGTQLASWMKECYPDKHIITINKPTDIESLQKIIEPTQKIETPKED
jgi:[acyl-carrier-protein] S-malonyltransferase